MTVIGRPIQSLTGCFSFEISQAQLPSIGVCCEEMDGSYIFEHESKIFGVLGSVGSVADLRIIVVEYYGDLGKFEE